MANELERPANADSAAPAGGGKDTSTAQSVDRAGFREHREALLDQALQETFPASDPVSITVADGGLAGGHSAGSRPGNGPPSRAAIQEKDAT